MYLLFLSFKITFHIFAFGHCILPQFQVWFLYFLSHLLELHLHVSQLISLLADKVLSILQFVVKLSFGVILFHDLIVQILADYFKIIFICNCTFVVFLELSDFSVFELNLLLMLCLDRGFIGFALVTFNLKVLQ